MPPLIEFKHAYANLVGQKYGTLNEKEKQTVYAMEIYEDSSDALIACDIFNATDLTPDFVEQQNRETFQYTDETVIKGNVIVNNWDMFQTYEKVIAGQHFGSLKESEKRTLYAYVLHKECVGNHPQACLIFAMSRDIRYVSYQLRNTYGYEDGTVC
jgi:hypothetical protein